MEVSTEAVARPVEVPEVPAEPEKVVPEVAESDSTDDAPGKEKDPGGTAPGGSHGREGRCSCLEKIEETLVEVFGKRCGKHASSLIPYMHDGNMAPQKIIQKMQNLKTHVLFTRAIFSVQPLFSGFCSTLHQTWE